MTLMTKVRWWLAAVLMIASTASVIRNKAESAPIVISVPHMSLSMEPTRPAMKMDRYFSANAWSILPSSSRASVCSVHSCRSTLAPVRLPSPPITTNASIPRLIRFWTAWRRPSFVRKASDRADPMEVPPFCNIPPPADHPAFRM